MFRLTRFTILACLFFTGSAFHSPEVVVESDMVRISDNATVYEGSVSLKIRGSILKVVSNTYSLRGSDHRFSGAVRVELTDVLIEGDELSIRENGGVVSLSSNRLSVTELSDS